MNKCVVTKARVAAVYALMTFYPFPLARTRLVLTAGRPSLRSTLPSTWPAAADYWLFARGDLVTAAQIRSVLLAHPLAIRCVACAQRNC
jgi:hypothetical protein